MAEHSREPWSESPTISPDLRHRDVNFGLKFTGYVEVPVEGVYTFYTRSDDGSTLWIDGVQTVDNDGLHGSRERYGQVALAAGKHAISVFFSSEAGTSISTSPGRGREWLGRRSLRRRYPMMSEASALGQGP